MFNFLLIIKNLRLKSFVVIFMSCVMLFSPVAAVVAAPLSSAELKALNEYPNWVGVTGPVNACTPTSGTLTGTGNVEKAFNFLVSKSLTAIQAAGIIGNLQQESGQGLDPTDDEQKGTATAPTPNDGFGIAQWTDPGRQQNLIAFAQATGKPVTDLGVQLEFLWKEFSTSYPGAFADFQKTTTISTATLTFMNGYESPNAALANAQGRIDNATTVYGLYGGSSSSGSSRGSTTCNGSVGVNCSGAAAVSAAQGLSAVRQNVVCRAQQELALWKSQPGYPNPAYAQNGYLKYSDGSVEEWCADFVSWIYNQSNYPFSGGSSGGWRIPAVATIKSIGQQNGNFHWHAADSGYVPKPGDLAIHDITGSHVNIFISSSGGASTYIGGDQGSGPYPGGSIVSTETGSGYYDGISGYVTPD